MQSVQPIPVDSRAYDLDGGALARDMVTQTVTVDPLAMSATCVFSTGAMDRVGDVVEVSGILTDNHERNPIVFWNHAKQLTLPIGKTVDTDGVYTVNLADDVATQTTFFSQSLFEAEQIFRLIDEGIINANSIAFDNKRVQPIFAAGVRKGLHILECDLLEISWVGLPVNPEAVRKAIDSLVCGKPLCEPVRRSLEPYAARCAAWANGVTLKCYDVRAMILKSAEFEESKHPRATDGRFGDKPGEHEGADDEGPDEVDDAEEEAAIEDDDVGTEELEDRWSDPAEVAQEINHLSHNATRTGDPPFVTSEAVDKWNAELESIDSDYRIYANPDGKTVAGLLKEEEAVVNGLESFQPAALAAANAEMEKLGDWRISWCSTVNPQVIHVDDYADDLSNNLGKILPQIKKRDDLQSLNEELEAIGDSQRVFYDGLKPTVLDGTDIDGPSLAAINDYAITGNDLAKAAELNSKIEASGYAVLPFGKYTVDLVPLDEIPERVDESAAAGISNDLNEVTEKERTGVAEAWNQFLADHGSNYQLVPDLDEGQFAAVDTEMLDDPGAVAEYIADQYDLSDGGEARVEWFNDLMAEYGSGDRLALSLDEDGELVVEVADGPETVKGLRFWSTKSCAVA